MDRSPRPLPTRALVAVLLLWAAPAHAYRPFDGTHADVAPDHQFEVELGPIGFLGNRQRPRLVAPGGVLNFGLGGSVELVLQTRTLINLGDGRDPAVALDDTGVFLKALVRRGSLQGGRLPSVAVEAGPLLPNAGGNVAPGFSAAVIVSQAFAPLSVHLNAQAQLTRAATLDLFGGVILEGPSRWRVRPVAEVYVDRDLGAALTLSGLLGGVWRVSEDLSIDVGLRTARVVERVDYEARAGLTWAVEMPRPRPARLPSR